MRHEIKSIPGFLSSDKLFMMMISGISPRPKPRYGMPMPSAKQTISTGCSGSSGETEATGREHDPCPNMWKTLKRQADSLIRSGDKPETYSSLFIRSTLCRGLDILKIIFFYYCVDNYLFFNGTILYII